MFAINERIAMDLPRAASYIYTCAVIQPLTKHELLIHLPVILYHSSGSVLYPFLLTKRRAYL